MKLYVIFSMIDVMHKCRRGLSYICLCYILSYKFGVCLVIHKYILSDIYVYGYVIIA